jgi:hypothetical protein
VNDGHLVFVLGLCDWSWAESQSDLGQFVAG